MNNIYMSLLIAPLHRQCIYNSCMIRDISRIGLALAGLHNKWRFNYALIGSENVPIRAAEHWPNVICEYYRCKFSPIIVEVRLVLHTRTQTIECFENKLRCTNRGYTFRFACCCALDCVVSVFFKLVMFVRLVSINPLINSAITVITSTI